MTEIQTEDSRFAGWWYVRDITHVCFYRHETMAWIAANFGWHMEVPRKECNLVPESERLRNKPMQTERTELWGLPPTKP